MDRPDELMPIDEETVNDTDEFDLIDFEIEELENRLALRTPEGPPDIEQPGCVPVGCCWATA
jgi:hypothetical protein